MWQTLVVSQTCLPTRLNFLLTSRKFRHIRAEVVFLFILAVFMMLVWKLLEPSLASVKLIDLVDSLSECKFHHKYDMLV